MQIMTSIQTSRINLYYTYYSCRKIYNAGDIIPRDFIFSL